MITKIASHQVYDFFSDISAHFYLLNSQFQAFDVGQEL